MKWRIFYRKIIRLNCVDREISVHQKNQTPTETDTLSPQINSFKCNHTPFKEYFCLSCVALLFGIVASSFRRRCRCWVVFLSPRTLFFLFVDFSQFFCFSVYVRSAIEFGRFICIVHLMRCFLRDFFFLVLRIKN